MASAVEDRGQGAIFDVVSAVLHPGDVVIAATDGVYGNFGILF